MDTLLAALTGGSSGVAGADKEALVKQMQQLWSHLDDMASNDPRSYSSFLKQQANEAGVDLPAGMLDRLADPATSATLQQLPPLVITAQIVRPDNVITPNAPSHARICIWKDSSGACRPATTASGEVISSSTTQWGGVRIQFQQHKPPSTAKHQTGVPVALYELCCHGDVVSMAAKAKPPQMRPVLMQAACSGVSTWYDVQLITSTAQLQVKHTCSKC